MLAEVCLCCYFLLILTPSTRLIDCIRSNFIDVDPLALKRRSLNNDDEQDAEHDQYATLSFFLGFRRPHLGPKNLSRTGGLEHYLVYGRPNQIPNLVGKTDNNVGGLAYILGLTNSHN